MYSKLNSYTGNKNNYNVLNTIRNTEQQYNDFIISNMKYGVKKQKKIYPYFKHFIKFLENHNIVYFLVRGSLLGCIRTGKSIAWDDDFDIYINTTEMQKLLNMSIQENSMKYTIEINNYKWTVTKNTYGFYQISTQDIKVTDIFNEKDNWYKKSVNPQGPPIRKQFHDILCNVGKNYHDELTFYYGKNYLKDYVLANHKLNSGHTYYHKDEYKYIHLDKLEYEKYLKYI